MVEDESQALAAHTADSAHLLSGFACFCISAHGSTFCRKSLEGASGLGQSLPLLSVAASAYPGCPNSCCHLNHCDFLSGWEQGAGLPHTHSAGQLPARLGVHCYSAISAKLRCSQLTPEVTHPFSCTGPATNGIKCLLTFLGDVLNHN